MNNLCPPKIALGWFHRPSGRPDALEAENERFCLGEGRSRNVLDAQRDLTDALKRQTIIAVELLRAYSNFMYASGYAGEF